MVLCSLLGPIINNSVVLIHLLSSSLPVPSTLKPQITDCFATFVTPWNLLLINNAPHFGFFNTCSFGISNMPMPKASDLAKMKASDLATPKASDLALPKIDYAGVKHEEILKLSVPSPEHLSPC